MGVVSDKNSYGIPADLIFSFPCKCANGVWTIVDGFNISDSLSQEKIKATVSELQQEKSDAGVGSPKL